MASGDDSRSCVLCGDLGVSATPMTPGAEALFVRTFGHAPRPDELSGICEKCKALPPTELRRRAKKAMGRLTQEMHAAALAIAFKGPSGMA